MLNILLILFPTQLFEQEYIEKIFSYSESNVKVKSLHIILIEHPYFFTKFPFHKMKLVFHHSSMTKYYDLIKSNEYSKSVGLPNKSIAGGSSFIWY